MFLKHIAQYAKSYASKEEYNYRLNVFRANYALVVRHNSANDQDFYLGMNQFADMSPNEFNQRLGLRVPEFKKSGKKAIQ